jgi:hypothetical protein
MPKMPKVEVRLRRIDFLKDKPRYGIIVIYGFLVLDAENVRCIF